MTELSVIIPTYNRNDILKMSLKALNEQTCSKNSYEVVTIDDDSTENNYEDLNNFVKSLNIQINLFRQSHQGPAAARNRGIKEAKGKIVLIINNDTIATPTLIDKHLNFHRLHPQEEFGLLGYVTWAPKLQVTPFMYWLEHGGPLFTYGEILNKEAGWQRFWTCNISLKKKFLLDNGLFDEDFPYAAWEDVELGYRLSLKGLRLFYDRQAIGYHYHPMSINSIKDKMRKSGESTLILEQKVPKDVAPPLGISSYRNFFQILDAIFLCKPILFLLEKVALWAETRINLSLIFNILMTHYRVEGTRRKYRKD